MAYFKIDNVDLSTYCSALTVTKEAKYTAQTNAAGNTVVDYINSKREVEVEIIALEDDVIKTVVAAIDKFLITVTYRDAKTGNLVSFEGILPDTEIEYYTIQAGKVITKAMKLTIQEL